MRVDGVDGEHYFKALYCLEDRRMWELSPGYFKSEKEAKEWVEDWHHLSKERKVVWPVEVIQDGYCLVPDSVQ